MVANFVKSDFSNRGFLPNLAKYYLLVLNALFLLMAVALCGFGIYFLIGPSVGLDTLTLAAIGTSYLIDGIVAILLAIVALIATYRENIKWLKVYLGILVVCVFLKSINGILQHTKSKSSPTPSQWKEQFDLYGKHETATQTVDIIQKAMSCCGFDGPETIVFQNGSYPWSCCLEPIEVCTTPFTDECSSKIDEWTSTMATAYNMGFYCAMVAKIFAIIATLYLISFLEEQQKHQVGTQYTIFITS